MKSGIYRIKNEITNKIYIGSATNITLRWSNHKSRLNKNIHPNRHLQLSWNKYLGNSFSFIVLEYVEPVKLLEREQYWIDYTKCYDKNIGYNKRIKAQNNFGLKATDDTKLLMSRRGKGRIFTESHKLKISISSKGKSKHPSVGIAVSNANKTRVGRKYNKLNRVWPCELGQKCCCLSCNFKRNEGRKATKERKLEALNTFVLIEKQ